MGTHTNKTLNHADAVISIANAFFSEHFSGPRMHPSLAAVTDAIMLLGNLELAFATDGLDWEDNLPRILADQEAEQTKRMRKLGRDQAKPGVSFGRGSW